MKVFTMDLRLVNNFARPFRNYFLVKLNTQNQKWNVYMRKTEIYFKQIYKLTKRFFKRLNIRKRKINKEVDQESIRIKQLNENILKLLLEKTGQYFIEKIKDKYSTI